MSASPGVDRPTAGPAGDQGQHGHHGPTAHALTLQRLREERLLRESVVIAEGPGLAVPVQWSRSLRDAVAEAEPLEGVVVIGDEADALPEVAESLAERGAAGLLVRSWTQERWREHPAPEGLPVLGVPAQTSTDALGRMVAHLSLAYESHVLQYAQTVHAALASLLHRGAGVSALCELLGRLSGCTVAVLDPQLNLRAVAEGRPGGPNPGAVRDACRELVQRVTDAPQQASSDAAHEPSVVAGTVEGAPVTAVIGAIELADQREGWIVLLDDTDPPLDHDIAEHRVVVQQAGTIIGTELLRVRSIERAEERARGNFVHALLHSRFSNQADLVARAEHHDFPVDARFGVVVVQARGLIAEDDSPIRLANMAREAGRLQGSAERRTMAAVVGDVIAVIRQVAPAARSGPDQGSHELKAFAAALARRLQAQTERAVLVSYGRPVAGAAAIGESYREARVALGLSAQLGLTAPTGFSDLRVHSTLLGLAQEQIGRRFADEILSPLRDAPGELEDAVRTYVQAGGNLNQAARDLSVHRNTMLYKLDRASKALNWDIRDAEAQFAVWLALKLDMLGTTADSVRRDFDAG